jgi:hypothetical protein
MAHAQRALLALILLSALAGCQPGTSGTPGGAETRSIPQATATAAATVTPTVSQVEAEQVAIYAAVIRRVYLRDDTFGGTLQAPVIYLVARTDDRAGDPTVEQAPSVALPEPLQAAISADLAALPARLEWVSSADEVARDGKTGAVAGGGAIITLGNIHSQADGSAQVSASIYVANLAAGGQTYILERVDGTWTVTGNTGTQWIS